MGEIKNIGLVAHDNRKPDLIEWVRWNRQALISHRLICTGTTGKMVSEAMSEAENGAKIELPDEVKLLKSGPLGGGQQLGALIAEGKADVLIFLWDPMQPQPHGIDVKALLRLAALYNIPAAHNRASADFIISPPLFNKKYSRVIKDYSACINRTV
jgi:methylglyoxal synthase